MILAVNISNFDLFVMLSSFILLPICIILTIIIFIIQQFKRKSTRLVSVQIALSGIMILLSGMVIFHQTILSDHVTEEALLTILASILMGIAILNLTVNIRRR